MRSKSSVVFGGRVPSLAVIGFGLVVCAVLIGFAPKWLRRGESHAAALPATPVESHRVEASLAPDMIALASDREEIAAPVAEEPTKTAQSQKVAVTHTFLPQELEPLSTLIPDHLAKFDAATPIERLQLGRELLSHSIAVIMCATGTGPIPKGQPGDGNLSYTGQEGIWSFQINTSTFHFHDYEFPEYPEYIALLSTIYDENMVAIPTATVELPEDLAAMIRQRAQEALSWL